jgi:hypothetical protein
LATPSTASPKRQRDSAPWSRSRSAMRGSSRRVPARKLRLVVPAALVLVALVILIIHLSSGTSAAEVNRRLVASGERTGSLQDWSTRVKSGEAADFSGELVNSSSGPVKLLRASLIGAPGHPIPRLVGVEISKVFGFESGTGWPLKDAPSRSFPGVIAPGKTMLTYATSGQVVGTDYFDLGLKIVYLSGGRTVSVSMWGPGVTCVRSPASVNHHRPDPRCSAEANVALKAGDAQAG